MYIFYVLRLLYFGLILFGSSLAFSQGLPQDQTSSRVVIVLESQPQTEVAAEVRSRYAIPLTEDDETAVRRAVAAESELAVSPSQEALLTRLRMVGATNIRRLRVINAVVATVPNGAMEALGRDPLVKRIVPEQRLAPKLDVSGPAMGVPAFSDVGLTGAGQSILLIDSGVDVRNPAFAGANIVLAPDLWNQPNYWGACSGLGGAGDDCSQVGHGTAVAGILVSQGAPGFSRHLGVARRATVYSVRAVEYTDNGTRFLLSSNILEAIDWGLTNTPASIINISYGDTLYPPGLIDTLDEIQATHNVIIVSPAAEIGTFCSGSTGMPPMSHNGIGVGATDDRNTVATADDGLSPNNGAGPAPNGAVKPDVVAPGVGIMAPSNYWDMNGQAFRVSPSGCHSSLATAHVSGALALLRQNGITDMMMAKAVLINSADGNGWSAARGFGAVNLRAAKTRGSMLSGVVTDMLPKLFIGPVSSGPLKLTTVARYRPEDPYGVGMSVVNRNDGSLVAESSGPGIVRQLIVPSGNYGVMVWTRFSASFALAMSREGFRSAVMPRVHIACSGPGFVALGGAMTFTCTASNSGDVEAHRVKATVRTADSQCEIDFGIVNGKGTRTRQCTARASVAGTFPMSATLNQYFAYNAWDAMDPPESTTFGPVVVSGARGAVLGRVVDAAGKPVVGATVRLSGALTGAAITDAAGECAFVGLPVGAGPVTVTATRAGSVMAPAAVSIPSISGAVAMRADFRVVAP